MTASTPAAPLPRARTLVHPGPVGPIRLEHRHANRARHFRLVLAPGRTMHDALAWPLRALGIGACSMTLLGGRLTGSKQAVFAGTVEEGKHEFDDHAKKGARALFFLLSNSEEPGVNRILTSEVETINLYPDSSRQAA